MNKFYLTLALSLSLVPGALAEQPDIIYVDGKPVYIGGLEPAADTQKKTDAAKAEAARTNIPGDIYRGTVLGTQTPTNRGEVFGSKTAEYRGTVLGEKANAGQGVPGDIYRGEVFGQTQKKYESDTLGTRAPAKTKYVYDTSLVRAIKTGDADRVRTLIYANVDVNERNYAGITPLTVAAEKGNMDIIKLLVEEGGASVKLPSSYGVTPLIAASAAGQNEAADYLLKNGADPAAKDDLGKTALLHAMSASDRRLTETLVKLNNRAVNVPDNLGNTPLIYAAQKGGVDNIRILLKYKADPDYQNPATGFSALEAAAAAGQEAAAQLLVRSGADVNLKDNEGRTALFYAAENGQTALIRQLLRMNADINVIDANGKNIFIAAGEGQSIPAMELLSRDHFSVNSADAKGKTAMMYTTAKGTQALQWLIDNGADLNLQDQNGNTALMHAIKNLNQKAALVLVKSDVDLTAVNKEGKDAFALAADLMPNSPVMTVLQVKKQTVLQKQLQARAAQQALANEEQAKLRAQAAAVAEEKLAEVQALQAQLEEQEAQVKALTEQQAAQKREELRAQVEREMAQKDAELAALEKQLAEAKAKREAEIQAQVDAKLKALDNQPSVLAE